MEIAFNYFLFQLSSHFHMLLFSFGNGWENLFPNEISNTDLFICFIDTKRQWMQGVETLLRDCWTQFKRIFYLIINSSSTPLVHKTYIFILLLLEREQFANSICLCSTFRLYIYTLWPIIPRLHYIHIFICLIYIQYTVFDCID